MELLFKVGVAAVCVFLVIILFSCQEDRCRAAGGTPDSSVSTRGPVCIRNGKLVNP